MIATDLERRTSPAALQLVADEIRQTANRTEHAASDLAELGYPEIACHCRQLTGDLRLACLEIAIR